MELNEDFGSLKDQILVMKPLPTVNKVFSLILKVEKHRTTQLESTDNKAMMTLSVKSSNHFGYHSYNSKRS